MLGIKQQQFFFACLSKLYHSYTLHQYFQLAQLPNASSKKCTIISNYSYVYLHNTAYPKQHLVTMDHNIVHMNLRNFLNHGTSYTRLPVLSFLQTMGLWRELFKLLRKLYKNAKGIIVIHTTRNQKQLQYIHLRVADEKKVANTSTFDKCKCKYQNKTQETNSQLIHQSLNRNDTVRYRQNNNWTRTGKMTCIDLTPC